MSLNNHILVGSSLNPSRIAHNITLKNSYYITSHHKQASYLLSIQNTLIPVIRFQSDSQKVTNTLLHMQNDGSHVKYNSDYVITTYIHVYPYDTLESYRDK